MTIAEIKKTMTDAFMSDQTMIDAYKLDPAKSFEDQFSPVSFENIIFYIVATCNWMTSKLFDQHKIDVMDELRQNRAHTPNWYAMRALDFQFGMELPEGSDTYDNTGLTPEQIAKSKIVKFAAAMETVDKTSGLSKLLVKVATGDNAKRAPLHDPEPFNAFTNYMGLIKDAGVWLEIINTDADQLELELDIYYNPMVLDMDGKRLDNNSVEPAPDAINQYIENLLFNGRYTNQGLVDAIQQVDGVEVVELKAAWWNNPNTKERTPISSPVLPYAGYFKMKDDGLKINYLPNE